MQSRSRGALMMLVALAMFVAGSVPAVGADHQVNTDGKSFVRISSFSVYTNNASAADETVAEIVAATDDGNTLVYTDAEVGQIGFVDITDPANPMPAGTVPVDGEPTAVDVYGDWALVSVNTSTDFVNASGELVVIDIASGTVVETLELGGQPDSIKVSPSGNYLAIVIENERDEDFGDGGIPQLPAGLLQVIELDGTPADWETADVDLTGIGYAPTDPEPEFVDINGDDIAVVSLQENNALAVVDLATLAVSGFDAGTVDLDHIDTVEEDVISLDGSLSDVPREPDAITWLNGDLIATANEGDLFGGSRGFSIFDDTGTVIYDSGNSFEHLAVRHGHYPENRSENKGTEPEGIEAGYFGGTEYLFVGSERGSFIAVYSVASGTPSFEQVLPAPLGPEGLLALPDRNLFIASGEVDDPTFGVRTTIQIYQLVDGAPAYPHILSANAADGTPIPWSALSGMVADPSDPDTLYAVWDSFYAESVIFTIDVSTDPAVITDALPITGGTGNFDPEGIAAAPDGTWWVASEGNASSRLNRLLQVDPASGSVLQEIGLPAEIEACRADSTNRRSIGGGFEGLTITGTPGKYSVFVAQQRGWDYTTVECEALDDDPAGVNSGEPGQTRIWEYDPKSGEWDWYSYDLEPVPANAAWVGLSEITALADGSFVVIERDNRTGDWAEFKTLQRIELDPETKSATKVSSFDLLPAMRSTNGWITDKPEGVAVSSDGQVYLVTDNDGVDDWSGETQFLRLGHVDDILEPGTGLGVPPTTVPPTSPPGQSCAPGCGKGNGGQPPGLARSQALFWVMQRS